MKTNSNWKCLSGRGGCGAILRHRDVGNDCGRKLSSVFGMDTKLRRKDVKMLLVAVLII